MKFYKQKNFNQSYILLETLKEVEEFIIQKDIAWNQSFLDYEKMSNEEIKAALFDLSNYNAIVSLAIIHSLIFHNGIKAIIYEVNGSYNEDLIDFFKLRKNIFVNKAGGFTCKEQFNLEEELDLIDISIEDFFK